MNIQGQAAIVTGGASGLGEATARELARLGAKVAVFDVNAELAAQVAADLNAQHGEGTAVACACDITSPDSVTAALALATVVHALLTGSRRQRRELAVLKALGFGRREIRASGAIQASTFSLVAGLLGLPLGVAVGTQAWRGVMDGLGLEVPVDLPVIALLLVVPATVVAGLLLAALPTRYAGRTHPAEALRAD